MTERELLETDEFEAFCHQWESDGVCPFPLIDWFLDRGQERLADAAKYSVEKRLMPIMHEGVKKNWYTIHVMMKNEGLNSRPYVSLMAAETFHGCIVYFFSTFDIGVYEQHAEIYDRYKCQYPVIK